MMSRESRSIGARLMMSSSGTPDSSGLRTEKEGIMSANEKE
jgi:hypothetical protein